MTGNSFEENLMKTLSEVEALDKAANAVGNEEGGSEQPLFESSMPTFDIAVKESKLTDEDESDIKTDYDRARNLTYALQDISLVMLKNSCSMAVATQHPKAYSTFNEIITNLRGLNKDLLDINKAANEVRIKSRTVPDPKKPETDGMTTTVTSDGNTMTVTMGPRPTTKSIFDVMNEAKKAGQSLENDEITKRALELDGISTDENVNAIDGSYTEVKGD